MHSNRHPHLVALCALLLAVSLSGCGYLFPVVEGDRLALRGAEEVAAQIGSHRDNTAQTSIDEMVVGWVPDSPVAAGYHGLATVDALAWSGQIGPQSEATIDVRIHVVVEAYRSPSLGGRDNTAGEVTVCYRLVWSPYEEATRSEISCPVGAVPPRPKLVAGPELTEEDVTIVTGILESVSEMQAIAAALHEAFPDERYRIDSALWNGETVVAVGIPAERECILAVRSEVGEVFYPSVHQISLEPGEAGCSTALYTHPPF